MNWLTNILGGLAGGITSVVDGWQRRQTARVEADVKRIEAEATIAVAQATATAELAKSAQANEAAWDLAMGSQMERSWKDEWFVLLLSVPLVLAFVGPWGAKVVKDGFEALEVMPSWYYFSLGTAVAATFGMRRLLTLFESARGARR